MGKKTVTLNAREFLMSDGPKEAPAMAGGLLHGADAAEPAPLAHGELGFPKELGDLCRRIELLDRASFHQHRQGRFNPVQTFHERR